MSGVVDVNNRVDMVGAAAEALPEAALRNPDLALATRIRTRYCWLAGLHDREVAVQVAGGRATLTGTVDTWLNRLLAAQEALEAGAHEVNNHLHVLNTGPRISHKPALKHGIEA